MARLGWIDDNRFLAHEPGAGHPERPERVLAVRRGVDTTFPERRHVTPQPADVADLLRVHRDAYVERVLAARGRHVVFDPDTATSPGSVDAALLAAGGAIMACRNAVQSEPTSWFCNVRPPGHHAESGRAMGFCLFNNVAVAAAAVLEEPGVRRVAIIDPDVHHGNGTQEIFWNDPRVLYASLHQFPFYPGTGAETETGGPDAPDTIFNFPLPAGAGDAAFLTIARHALVPVLDAFRPELLIVSAGFDAHRLDPLGGLRVSTDGFAGFFATIGAWARSLAVPVVCVLEGGYSLEALEAAVPAALLGLLGATDVVATAEGPEPEVTALVQRARRRIGR